MRQKVICIVGARPNFIKSAPLMRELRKHPDAFDTLLVHTGQHYDQKLSQLFFDDLKMAQPDIFLGVGSGSHAQQTARIMIELEKVAQEQYADLVIVFGDVNSTMAAAIVAAKLCVKIAHVEAGLRSNDRTMPEEINRIVTDHLSDFLFVTEQSGLDNLRSEGIDSAKVFFTGNIMIDSLVDSWNVARDNPILEHLSLEPQGYAVMTLHRPSNVDDKAALSSLLGAIRQIARRIPIIFPCHPRTQKNLAEFNLLEGIDSGSLRVIEPLGYIEFTKLVHECRFVLTDSGGIQEETTYSQIPCITMRTSTERPITVDVGSNILAGVDPHAVLKEANRILDGQTKKGRIPDLWDGRTAERIVQTLLQKRPFSGR